jgi:SanA protein
MNYEPRTNKWLWLSVQIALILLFAAALFVYLVNLQINSLTDPKAKNSITEIRAEDPPRVAIVFGAGDSENNSPSPALYDRVITAVELYRAGRVGKLLMSGDNRLENYNEPEAMKKLAIERGVRETDVVADFAGRRTYDTCRRAKEVFNVNRAVLVTQEFHVRRALYLCESIGIDSVGMNADRRRYPASFKTWQSWREVFAIAGAWLDINIWRPTPILDKKEFIQN